jgi:flavin reductase (DIM6/NTAB) family NADH-FMN oxidoreductase RutF
MKEVNSFENFNDIVSVLRENGAFLTVRDRTNKLNTMTIGWALLGVVWRKPILMIAVRPDRYTFNLLENADDFTVTFPFSDMKKELTFCGANSGRDLDKFRDGSITILPSQKVRSPVIEAKSARYYECKIVEVAPMDAKRLNPDYEKNLYPGKSHHMFYFGEIVACYEACPRDDEEPVTKIK